MDHAKWMLVGEVGELLDIGSHGVHSACRRGQLAYVRTPGRIRRVDRRSAERLYREMYPGQDFPAGYKSASTEADVRGT